MYLSVTYKVTTYNQYKQNNICLQNEPKWQ